MADKAKNGKEVTVTIGEKDLDFKVTIEDFSYFQDNFMPGSKVAGPAHNFCVRCVKKEHEQELREYLDQGFAVDIATIIATEFKPEVTLTVKK